jgi:hypothetical protein
VENATFWTIRGAPSVAQVPGNFPWEPVLPVRPALLFLTQGAGRKAQPSGLLPH